MDVLNALRQRTPDAPPVVLVDFSPPRGADLAQLEAAGVLAPDFFCVAYAPGRAVRPDPFSVALALQQRRGIPSVVNLSTRDSNALALSNALLGAHLLGIRSVVALAGDDFGAKDRERGLKTVRELTPTGLLALIREMNAGRDLRGLKLTSPTSFAIGATVDLSRGIAHEARLARRKVEAGAAFLLTQPIYDPADYQAFVEALQTGGGDVPPMILGLDVPSASGVTFSSVPEWVQRDLNAGRSGADVALEAGAKLVDAGVPGLYVVPTILKGGARDYAGAVPVIEAAKRRFR